MAGRAQDKPIEVSCEIGSGVPLRVLGDPDRLRQIITNLMSNLAIVDSRMPDRNGFDFVRSLKPDPLRIIMLTSAGETADMRKARKLGIAAYLSKPVPQMDLLDCVASVLTSKTAGRRGPLITASTMHEARKRLKVLLAEDNVVNQQVALAMLHRRGHEVDVAQNGLEAIAAVQANSYDIVLMDMQMPELDGLEATRRIRALGKRGTVPIVALTANAGADHQKQCFDAGMNGFISKPFRPFNLFAAVERDWATAEIASPAQPKTGSGAIDIEAFRATMREAGIEEMVPATLSAFQKESPSRLESIKHALASSNASDISASTHALKSSAGAIGAKRLAELLSQSERSARAGDVAACGRQMPEILTEFASVESAVRAFLAGGLK